MAKGNDQIFSTAMKAKDKEKSWSRWLTEGPPGYGVIIFLCGLLTTVTAFTHFSKSDNAFEYLIHFYLIFYGILIMMLEISVCILIVYKGFKRRIERSAKFLGRIWGRGLFYIYVASLLVFLEDLFSRIVGGLLAILGLIGLIIWFCTFWKMIRLRRKLQRNNREKNPAVIREVFSKYDADHSGYIDRKELYKLSNELGYPLEGPQLQSAFEMLDADRNGKIDMDEFLIWWLGKIPDPIIKEKVEPDEREMGTRALANETDSEHVKGNAKEESAVPVKSSPEINEEP